MMTATVERPILEIGDLGRALNVTVDTIRRWERAGKIAPAKRTSSGRRVFTAEDLEVIRATLATRAGGASPPDAA